METTRSQESTNAIERMYITMRHLLNRGFYKPMGVSGETLRNALLQLRPEIYGSIAEDKAELEGLIYVLERLPHGIEQCKYINLTSDEGYGKSHFKAIVPPKRRRNCYRIDEQQMNIEITRGRSDIYDILTHLTFLFIESDKIGRRVLIDEENETTIRDWGKLKDAVQKGKLSQADREVALIHTANILGRSFVDVMEVHAKLATKSDPERFLKIVYWLGRLAIEERTSGDKRTITFSALLRERLGHHIHGERWANTIKETLHRKGLLGRPIHIISSNMHSVLNTLFARKALGKEMPKAGALEVFEALSHSENDKLRTKVANLAAKNGMIQLDDTSGANIDVQIFDTGSMTDEACCYERSEAFRKDKPVILVMDYAFGEQAYESVDELLKPYRINGNLHYLDVHSISIMGKAGILQGDKGDLMIPSAHIFEGTADNYPFPNQLSKADFEDCGLEVCEGTMVTVLGTSLQNKDILTFFLNSTWNVIGLEMEGVHYQKAIQSASRIRKSIREDVQVRYAYYASDNPLKTGHTLASGGLGTAGVKPTYLITDKILMQIFNSNAHG
ncbi:hypothetical protein OZ410_04110 [Robiginitalea sp. M366]|uniref:DUF6909 family protein n=1 Tax=Robiginitalea aestuariiviva TaxID=3036903 RepID=UPI00240D0584|nr:hypothetical protein [Robiginitalea aestuariiviva]MDG1571487.1 hypothetical protein [Robiginitalea aestuariiviva]